MNCAANHNSIKVFLTSSPTREIGPCCRRPELYRDNGFVDRLGEGWPEAARCLMVAAFPGEHGRNDEMTAFYRAAVENAGLPVARFDLWDDRWGPEGLGEYDVIFLAGGHIATEMEWFRAIGLKDLLARWEGILVGTSAGSMNAAREVYAWPEEPGESFLPPEDLFFPGLGLAETVVLPHLNKLRGARLDGRLLVEDIARDHSLGRRFLAIPDGSYVLAHGGEEWVFGHALLVENGEVTPFCREGESRRLR